MASLKEIKNRIASVGSTRKITSAMKLVASSKLHHAQVQIGNMLPYESLLEKILKSFLAAEKDVDTVYNRERPVKRVALVVYSSNSSLCGGFNTNVIKLMNQVIDEYSSLGKENIEIYAIGKKCAEKAEKSNQATLVHEYSALADKPNIDDCISIAVDLGTKFRNGEIDKVEIIYHHFKSAGTQILTRKVFLPIDVKSEIYADKERDLESTLATSKSQEYLKNNKKTKEKTTKEAKPLNDNFIVEPNVQDVLNTLIPKLAHLVLYTALLDSNASEHAARMVAMQTATDNADELLKELNLQYNKSRQNAITSELLDIVGGSLN